MRSRIPSWIRTGLLLAVVAGTQSGCKSGWKMPGSDMFSWTRKPSASTLAGNSPSVTMPTPVTMATTGTTASNAKGPQSPALRSSPTTPSSIVNTNTNRTPAAPYGRTGAGPYGMPNTNTPGGGGTPTPMNTIATTPPASGGAALNNGYSTGNYGPTPTRPMAGAPNNPIAMTPNNPYGNMQPLAPLPTMPNGLAGGTPPAPPSNTPPSGYGFVPPPGTVPNMNMVSTPPPANYPPAGNSIVPSMPVAYGGSGNLPPSIPPQSSMPNAYGGAQSAPAAPAVVNNVGTPAYRPGSMARQTSYDFSNQGPGAVSPAGGSSYPRTADESSSGSVYR